MCEWIFNGIQVSSSMCQVSTTCPNLCRHCNGAKDRLRLHCVKCNKSAVQNRSKWNAIFFSFLSIVIGAPHYNRWEYWGNLLLTNRIDFVNALTFKAEWIWHGNLPFGHPVTINRFVCRLAGIVRCDETSNLQLAVSTYWNCTINRVICLQAFNAFNAVSGFGAR